MPTQAATPDELADLAARVSALEAAPDDDVDDEARAQLAELLNSDSDVEADLLALSNRLEGEILTLQARIAKAETKPDDDIDDVARAQIVEDRARLAALESAPTGGGGSTGAFGAVMTPFVTLGANDTERFTNWFAKAKAGWKGEVQFECRLYNCPVQWPTLADLRCVGTQTRAGEWNNATIINYTGPAGTSMFSLYTNSGYSYPANGVSRNVCASGIQFRSGNDRDFLPPAPGGFDGNYVQWYWQFDNCAWVGWRKVFNGWGDGLDVTGMTHFQAYAVTPLKLGGAENKWFLGGGLADSGNATWKAGGQPIIECSMDKSVIGSIMLSAQLNSYQLKVTYGTGTRCIGTEFDSSDGSPTQGHQVRFIGTARTFHFVACTFKGGDGILCSTGATEVGVESCSFQGNRALARCESTFSGVLLWGLTNTYGQCPREIRVARGAQVVNADPRVTVKSLDGALVGIRNPDGTYTTARKADGTVVPF